MFDIGSINNKDSKEYKEVIVIFHPLDPRIGSKHNKDFVTLRVCYKTENPKCRNLGGGERVGRMKGICQASYFQQFSNLMSSCH
jgi:hypothetical protein